MKHWFFLLVCWAFVVEADAQYFAPAYLPNYSISPVGSTGPDYVCMGVFRAIQPSAKSGANMVLDRNGEPVLFIQGDPFIYDFKVHPNGLMSFFMDGEFLLVDSTLAWVGSVSPIGRSYDVHELFIGPDDHYYLFGLTWQDSVDLSALTTVGGSQGDTLGRLEVSLIQEIDQNGNLVKEWLGTDHFEIDDVDLSNFSDPGYLPWMHANSIDMNASGQMLVSWRNLSEVTLIDWATGDVIWRLGGAENQFTFVNDTLGFSAQHDARFLPGNRISIFDNGTYRQPRQARAIIYELDTIAMTATQVWEYAKPYDSRGLGSFRIASDGTRIINFGDRTDTPVTQVELVDVLGNSLQEYEFESEFVTYRAIYSEIPWAIPAPAVSCEDSLGYTVLSIPGNHTRFSWNTGESSSTIAVQDTGTYFAFVDMGIGMIRSEKFHLNDAMVPCNGVSIDPVMEIPKKLIAVRDLYGREVRKMKTGQVYIQLWSDGSSRKIVHFGN